MNHLFGKLAGIWLCVGLVALPIFAKDQGPSHRERRAASDALFTNGVLHVLKFNISGEGMRALNDNPREYVKATLREGDLVYSNILVRLKGGFGSFRDLSDKPGLTVKLPMVNTYFHGLEKFHLNNSVQDETYLSEWVCSDIFRCAGVPAGRIAHAVVELNGRRLGLYTLLESFDSEFFERYFKDGHGNLYSLSPNSDISGLERIGGREMTKGADIKTLATVARDSNVERLRERLSKVLDVPRFLSFMAVEVLLDHWDGYTFNVKNYAVYHDPERDQMVFLPHDLDQVLRNERAPVIPGAQGMVAKAILRVPELRTQYQQRFQEIYTNCFIAADLNRRIDERIATLSPSLKKYDRELAHQLTRNSNDLKNRISRRARALSVRFKPKETDATAPKP